MPTPKFCAGWKVPVPLPGSTEPAITAYETKRDAWVEAKHALEEVRHQATAAAQAQQLARVAAAEAGQPAPVPEPDDWSVKVADAQGVVAAHRTVVDRAARSVETALRDAAGELFVNAAAQYQHDRAKAAEALAQFEASMGACVESLATLGHVSRRYLAQRVGRDVIVRRRDDVDQMSTAQDRYLAEVLTNSSDEILRGNHRFQTGELHRYLASTPPALDELVQAYLRPYLSDDGDVPNPAPEKPVKASKAKAGTPVVGVDV